MLDFDEELKKFKPSLEMENIEARGSDGHH